MGSKELCQKYGTTQTRRAVNAAIRAEIPGGGRTLDLLAEIFPARGADERLARVFERLQEIREEMVVAVAEKYDLKTRKRKPSNERAESGTETPLERLKR